MSRSYQSSSSSSAMWDTQFWLPEKNCQSPERNDTVSRPLFIYVKKAHVGVIPGMSEFLTEFTSEAAWGQDGYLADKGLIPAPKAEQEEFAKAAKDLKPLVLE